MAERFRLTDQSVRQEEADKGSMSRDLEPGKYQIWAGQNKEIPEAEWRSRSGRRTGKAGPP